MKKRLLVLLAGQSNMAGRDFAEADDLEAIPGLLMISKDRKWRPAVEPITKDRPFVGTFGPDGKKICSPDPWDIVLPTDSETKVKGVGPGRTFGRLLLEANPDCEVGLIPTAVGGTGLVSWMPGGIDPSDKSLHPYDDAIVLAKEAQLSGRIVAVLWHQGETDASQNNTNYKAELAVIIGNFRQALNLDISVPFIMGELADFYRENIQCHVDMIDQAMYDLEKELPAVRVIKAKDLQSRGDDLHFNREGAHILGQRYFEAFQRFTGN